MLETDQQKPNRAARRQVSRDKKKQDKREQKQLMKNTPNGNKFNSKKSRCTSKVTPQTKKDGASLIENPTIVETLTQQETPEIKHSQEEVCNKDVDNTNFQEKEKLSDINNIIEEAIQQDAFEENVAPIESGSTVSLENQQENTILNSIENEKENKMDNLSVNSKEFHSKDVLNSIKDNNDHTMLTQGIEESAIFIDLDEIKKEQVVISSAEVEGLTIKSIHDKKEELETTIEYKQSDPDNSKEEKEDPKKELPENKEEDRTNISINESERKDETVLSNKDRTLQENIPTPSITTATTVSDKLISPSTSTSPSNKKKVNLVSKLFTKYKEGKKAKLLKSAATTTTTITTAVSTSSSSTANNKKKKVKSWKVWKKL